MGKSSHNDNHSNQLNPNNDEYWRSRGWEDGRPEDWSERIADQTQPGFEGDGDSESSKEPVKSG